MSTNIRAFKFKDGMNLEEAVSWVKTKAKPLILENEYNNFKSELLSTAIDIYDREKMKYFGWVKNGDDEARKCFISLAFDAIKKENKETFKNMGGMIDPIKMNVYLFTHESGIYGVFNCKGNDENIDFKDVLRDYSYWNNTDRPSDVSKEEWEERKNTWDDIFMDSSSLNEVGIIIQISKDMSLDMNYGDFWKQIRKMKENKTLGNFNVEEDSIKKRLLKTSYYINHAPWNSVEVAGDLFMMSNFMRHDEKIKAGEIESFNVARDFLDKNVFEKINLDMLSQDCEEAKKTWEKERQSLYNMDIPKSLLTPSFEKKMLSDKIDTQNKIKKPKVI